MCDPSLIPARAGIVHPVLVLIPPDEDQDPAISRVFSNAENMKYLMFMMRPGGLSLEGARAKRRDRDERQLKKELLNYTIALKRSQIPAHILDSIGSDEFLPPRQIPIDGGCIDMDEPYFIAGCCGLNNVDIMNHSCEAGIIIDRRLWRSGLSSVSLYLTLKHGFETLHMHRIGLVTTGANVGMRGWMENVVGVSVECIRKEALFLGNNTYIDAWNYAMFDHQWHGGIEQRLQERVKKYI
ncbi:hypothetical protein GGI25_000310 [Coemansia spiralis]|uniref:N-acetyltransferase domain-containing protein n=2 Tax=Coemansia TaxID=4863 RepID=A0A9W8G8N7_9FUNG|nr:hypothetical protein BX070DRAFT_236088 [Coemansia spiralis]KAJ1995815.1 hypothetical protein EDC05_000473 [Coemansia umbellata]KAJ2625881.1 hypothetical protein GGI26_000344 [Coemansia sp. RSA 1358]KAJ2681004.1 hypothetical protein GGI25_000310 [Coemansia spiralis]